MVDPSGNDFEPTPPSLLIAAHCSTMRRKKGNIHTPELSAMLDDFVRELSSTPLSFSTYLNSLNEIVRSLNANSIPALINLNSHQFFLLVRNTVRNLLQKSNTTYQLTEQEIYVLRNCVKLLKRLVKKIPEVSTILHWITDLAFTDALGNCLYEINNLSQRESNVRLIKQITRLLNIFASIQERLPIHLHQTFFTRLLEPTIICLTSTTYVQLFNDLKTSSTSLKPLQKFFLNVCPHFLTSYYGPHMEKTFEQILETMLPRYVSILDKHMKQIKAWQRPMIRSMYYLLTTLVFAEGHFTKYLNNQSLQLLIDHLFTIIKQSIFIKKIDEDRKSPETLLIDSALLVFGVLIFEMDALKYIRKCKPAVIFQKLLSTPCESIVFNAYVMLAYTINENDIKQSRINLSLLITTIFKLLHETIGDDFKNIVDSELTQNRHVIQLAETLRGLVRREHSKNEIAKQNELPFLMECSIKMKGLAKRFFLECLWTLSFDEKLAEKMRQNTEFIRSLKDIPVPYPADKQENTVRRSYSFSSGRNSAIPLSEDVANNEIYSMTDGLLWNLVKESEFRKKHKKSIEAIRNGDHQNYKCDIMISYSNDDKVLVHQIHEYLVGQGFNVWFEDKNTYGQTMETLVDAIDNSALVVACVSKSYTRDNHCQALVKYAYRRKRIIIPLMVQKGYRIGGWLDTIVNKSKLIDFSSSDFKKTSKSLSQEINQHLKTKVSSPKTKTNTQISFQQNAHPSTPVSANRTENKTTENITPRSATPTANNATSTEKPEMPAPRIASRSVTPAPRIPSRPVTPAVNNSTSIEKPQTPAPRIPSRPVTPAVSNSTSIEKPQIPAPRIPIRSETPAAKNSAPIEKPQTPAPWIASRSTTPTTKNSATIEKPQTPAPQIPSRSATPTTNNSARIEKPQIPVPRIPSRPVTPAVNNSTSIEKPQIPAPWIPIRSVTPAANNSTPIEKPQTTVPNLRTVSRIQQTVPIVPVQASVNGNGDIHLPEQYTKRDTSKSGYRSIPVDQWKQNDVLDFLYDAKLNIIMPLCESMSGPQILSFFRQCQENSSRLYIKLNQELRSRFQYLTLPMGIYTQFLLDLDDLIGPTSEKPSLPSRPGSDHKENFLNISTTVQQQVSPIQHNPIPLLGTTVSPTKFMTYIPVEMKPDSTSPGNRRVIERAIFRPATAVSPGFDLVVESDEETTEILQKVDRHETEILLLEQQTRAQRKMNGFH